MGFRAISILSVVLGEVGLPLVLGEAGSANAQVRIDDFPDGNDDGWTHFDYTEESRSGQLFLKSATKHIISPPKSGMSAVTSTLYSRCGMIPPRAGRSAMATCGRASARAQSLVLSSKRSLPCGLSFDPTQFWQYAVSSQ